MQTLTDLIVEIRDLVDDHPEALAKPLILRHKGVDFSSDLTLVANSFAGDLALVGVRSLSKAPALVRQVASELCGHKNRLNSKLGELLVQMCMAIKQTAKSTAGVVLQTAFSQMRVLFCKRKQCVVLEIEG